MSSRFSPRHYPTLLLLRQGEIYAYEGERTVKAFREFAEGGYSRAASVKLPAPGDTLPSPTVWSTLQARPRSHLNIFNEYPDSLNLALLESI